MKKRLGFALMLCLTLAAVAHADGDSDAAVQGYGWRIVNFISAMAAISIAGGLAWCMTDLETHGRKAKGLLIGLIGLGCIYGLVRVVASSAEASGTSVSGFNKAADMKP